MNHHPLPGRIRAEKTWSAGFTLVELLVVISIIIALAGLVLAVQKGAWEQAARSRATAEIKAMEVALESYYADYGDYPRTSATDALDPRTAFTASAYESASLDLYTALSGDSDNDGSVDAKVYMSFPEKMLSRASETSVAWVKDPWGAPYGYSTAYAQAREDDPDITPSVGYNPDFDLWSTGGARNVPGNGNPQAKWVTNWL